MTVKDGVSPDYGHCSEMRLPHLFGNPGVKVSAVRENGSCVDSSMEGFQILLERRRSEVMRE